MELHATIIGSSYEGECEIRQLFDGSGWGADEEQRAA